MSLFRGLYSLIILLGNLLQPFFLLAIRLLWGLGFFFAGFGKFADMEKVIGFFTNLGIPFPEFNAYLVATVETAGGLFLILGFAARFAALPLVITMLTALGTAHLSSVKGAVENFQDNFEAFSTQAPIGYLFTALVVLCFGPGLFSVDAVFKKLFCGGSQD